MSITRIPDCHGGVLYSIRITASSGLTITSGGLPLGLQYHGAFGTITGTPPTLTSLSSADFDSNFTLSDGSQWVICLRNNINLTVWTKGSLAAGSTYQGIGEVWVSSTAFGNHIFRDALVDPTGLPLTKTTVSGIAGSLFRVGLIGIYASLTGTMSGGAHNDTPSQYNEFDIPDYYSDTFNTNGPPGSFPYIAGGVYYRAYGSPTVLPLPHQGTLDESNGLSGVVTGGPAGSTTGFDWGFTPPAPSASWSAGATIATGAIITDVNGVVQIATTGGITGSSAPTWSTTGGTTSDGTVIWQGHGTQPFSVPSVGIVIASEHFNPLAAYTLARGTLYPSSGGGGTGPWVIQEITAELIPSKGVIDGKGHYRYTVRCVDSAQTGTYLGFWGALGGSGGSASNISSTAGQPPGAPGQPPFTYSYVSPLTTKGDIFGRSTVDARVPVGADGQILTARSSDPLGLDWESLVRAIGCTIDGGGLTPSTGLRGTVQVPFDCTIVGWTMIADASGSAQITVKMSTYAAYPATASIVASAPPNLSGAQKNTSTVLTGWTVAIPAGSVLDFNLDSVTGCTYLVLQLKVLMN